MTAAAGAPASCRPAIDDPRLDFVSDAERFAREHRGLLAFRLLRWMLRADDDELDALIAKLYCDAQPEVLGEFESLGSSVVKAIAHPFKVLVTKKWASKRGPAVEYDLEIGDPSHFAHSFARIYAALPEPKRVSPSSTPCRFPGSPEVDPIMSTVRLSTALRHFLAPLAVPGLWRLSRRAGLNLLAPYRRAIGLYAVYEGHFVSYPCRHFIRSDDTLNPPARHIAFRQNCEGKFFVVQNGQGSFHPAHAFGRMDVYLTCGEHMARLAPEVRLRAPRLIPVGCLNLDRRLDIVAAARAAGGSPRWDVVLIDQGIWPYNDLDRRTGLESFEAMFRALNALKKRRPELRVAVQLRPCAEEPARAVRQAHARCFTEPIDILKNSGRGESYETLARTRVAICYNSSLGFEAFFLAPNIKSLFVNFAGHPFAVYSWDSRFQIYDPSGDAAAFGRRVEELLDLDLPEPPEVAREQILAFDGRTQERVAEAIVSEASR